VYEGFSTYFFSGSVTKRRRGEGIKKVECFVVDVAIAKV
jgi:hypothetical protein